MSHPLLLLAVSQFLLLTPVTSFILLLQVFEILMWFIISCYKFTIQLLFWFKGQSIDQESGDLSGVSVMVKVTFVLWVNWYELLFYKMTLVIISRILFFWSRASLVALTVRNLPANKRPWIGKIPWKGNGNPLQYSYLEKSMDRRAWYAAVHGVAKSPTRLGDLPFTFHFHALEKEMAAHSSVLAWRIPGTGEPLGCSLWGRTESDMTEVT